jgi:predicted nucleic acid-binding protein
VFPASFPVVLNANVLIPLSIRDTLLRAANEGLIQIYWSEEILDEVQRNLIQALQLSEEKASRLITAMKKAFPEAMVSGHDWLIPAMRNDVKDRHVLAVAVHVGAQTIVTNNLRDFRKEHLPPRIQAQDPDTFLQHLFDQNRLIMMEVLCAQAEALRRPPLTLTQLLDGLAKSVPGFVEEVRRHRPQT